MNPLKKKIIWSLIRIDISLWMFLKVEQKYIKIDYWCIDIIFHTLWIWWWAGQQVHCEESCPQCLSHSQPAITGVRQRRLKLGYFGSRRIIELVNDTGCQVIFSLGYHRDVQHGVVSPGLKMVNILQFWWEKNSYIHTSM